MLERVTFVRVLCLSKHSNFKTICQLDHQLNVINRDKFGMRVVEQNNDDVVATHVFSAEVGDHSLSKRRRGTVGIKEQ